ncbi:MAG: sigma-70 family RNA polymerase sigma factor [Sedimentisphaerales bacterium]|nr:sigma-70 family RNA polymerase sigma factor [Sedimentisphaerales bacterium]
MGEEHDIDLPRGKPSKTECFLRLIVPNNRRIYAYILTMVHNIADADDIMQETSAVMWRKFSEFKPGTDFAAWGIQIARYECLMFKRQMHHRHLEFQTATEEALLQKIASSNRNSDKRLKFLNYCLAKLDNKKQELLRMRYQENITQKSIAERTGLSEQTICKRFAKIHDMLLRCIRRSLAVEEAI